VLCRPGLETQIVSQHLSEKDIRRYGNRRLSPAEILSLDDHLAHCRSCQVAIGDDSAAALTQITTALEPESDFEENHLPYQQMADYVDDDLTDVDREIVNSRLVFCSSCKAEVQDLMAMKATLAALPGTEYSRRPASRLWTRLAALWQLPSIRIPVQAATAVVLVIVIVWVAALYHRRHAEEARTKSSQRDQAITTNSGTPPPGPGTTNALSQPQDQHSAEQVTELVDGNGRVTLDSNDKLSGLESASPQIQNEVRSVLKSEHVNAPSFVRSLKGESGRLMGGNRADYGLRNPVATAVESANPTFRWNAVEGAENYTVTIYDVGSKRVLTSGPVLKNIWKTNSALERGRTYSWQVRAIKDGREVLMPPPAAADAKFRIIEQNKFHEIQLARKSHPKSYLVLGVVYAEAGMLDESERELQKLLDANPKSPVARSLLHSVRSLRR